MAPRYRVENDELVVLDGRRVCYRGRLGGHPVERVVAVPGSRDAIALFKYESEEAPAHFPNLARVHPDGEIQWQARPPEREPEVHDSWIAFPMVEARWAVCELLVGVLLRDRLRDGRGQIGQVSRSSTERRLRQRAGMTQEASREKIG